MLFKKLQSVKWREKQKQRGKEGGKVGEGTEREKIYISV